MSTNPITSPRVRGVGLAKAYGLTTALEGVTVEIRDGESVAVMGPSGSGKTTLLHLLAGIVRPDAGEVVLRTDTGPVSIGALDDDARSALRLREFGFVFQQGLLLPELTAVENISLPLLLAGATRAAAESSSRGLLSSLGLDGLGERRIGQLSGGQAQRVAIARAVVGNPPVVFADEPTGALDSTTASEVLDLLLSLTARRGRALVLVTHDESVAARCSRVLRMKDGRVVSDSVESRP